MSARPARRDGALSVLRRGLAESPELRRGAAYTIALAFITGLGAVLIPVLIQLVLDRGVRGPDGFRPAFVYGLCAGGAALIGLVYFSGRATFSRMVVASENALANLRVRTFAHLHSLSISAQSSEKRGALVSRVTADIDTLAEFMEWGALAWITGSTLALMTTTAMLVYSWQLTLVVIVTVMPLFFVLRRLQRGLLRAYDAVRERVAETLSEISESLMGAAVVRAYGIEDRVDRRVKASVHRRYDAQMRANRYMATIFPVSDVFGAVAVGLAIAFGVWLGPSWDLSAGRLIAFLFLVNLFVQPLVELSETFDQTQTAIAGWRKVLGVLDMPSDVVEPQPGVDLPTGPLEVVADGVEFAYAPEEGLVLRGIDAEVLAGAHVAIVGETGCGKTTFAKLLCRLADPTSGQILLGGIDLRGISPASRQRAVRMVPQDGFLFDSTILENVRYGRPGATDAEIHAIFAELGLFGWVASLPAGLRTLVGQRGDSLSAGERQLVAVARAHIADPGVLILDEATSAVDPETEKVLAEALHRLSRGRTTLTIAHRLSTAESADAVLVFDRGQIVERGAHASLVKAQGVYARLYRSWLGNTARA